MCGINLVIAKRESVSSDVIVRMNQALDHRGPDASGWLKISAAAKDVFIGNTRLKIVDLSDEGNQPLCYQNRYYLSFNGEIYNYRELKKNLEKEFPFQSGSDSEVLLFHLIKYGSDGIDSLNGMFAFAFYDAMEDKLLAARDRFGVKPVYYWRSSDCLILSSELRGIFASGMVEKKLNSGQIPNYLSYKFALKPQTFYQDVFELEEGKCLTLSNTTFTQLTYGSPEKIPEPGALKTNEVVEKTELYLKASVEGQLGADVPAGLFLSGGVDSSLLLALIRETGVRHFPCFCIANKKEDKQHGTEDYLYARKAASLFDGDLQMLEIDSTILHKFLEYILSIDQPIADPASMLTWVLSGKARESVKVILTGAGADEYFAGYNRHYAFYNYLRFLHKKPLALAATKSLSKKLGSENPLFRKASRLFQKFSLLDPDPALTYLQFCSLSNAFYESSYDKKLFYNVEKTSGEGSLFDYGLQFDQRQYLISDVLAVTDSMTMQNSIECRVPYLDNSLVSYLQSLNSEYLISSGKKWILKRILINKGGRIFCERKKEGFGMPLGKWLRSDDAQTIQKILCNENNPLYEVVSYEKLINLLRIHQTGKKDLSFEIWSMAVLAGWLDREF